MTANDSIKQQYKDSKYVNVSVRANSSYTFSIKVRLGTGFVNNQNITFTVYANWWDGVKYPYLKEINTKDNNAYAVIKTLEEPKTEPTLKINLIDKSGRENVEGKQFAVWMYSQQNRICINIYIRLIFL